MPESKRCPDCGHENPPGSESCEACNFPLAGLPAAVDRDLWAILRWMIEGVGGDWTVRDLEETGRLYRVPAAL